MKYNTTAYRTSSERPILFVTVFLVGLVIALSATVTLCMSGVFLAGYIFMAYLSVRSHHEALMQQAHRVSHQRSPRIYTLIQICSNRLQVETVDVFIIGGEMMNAYTFGITSPKVVVLHSAVIDRLDARELSFVLGHEMGHVRLGHTWLNTLVGGMAGLPAPAAGFALLQLIFRWWNRACEYSADRAGLLACGSLEAAISALVKIEAGTDARTQADLAAVARRLDAEDDTLQGSFSELMRSHPLTINRIEALQNFAKSRAYRTMQAGMDSNLQA